MKKIFYILLVLVLALSAVSCQKERTQTPQNETMQTDQPSSGDIADKKDDTSDDKKSDEKPGKPVAPAEKTAIVAYYGRVDTNFIEVGFEDGEFGTMQLSEDAKKLFDNGSIKENDKITVFYTENGGVKQIVKVNK